MIGFNFSSEGSEGVSICAKTKKKTVFSLKIFLFGFEERSACFHNSMACPERIWASLNLKR